MGVTTSVPAAVGSIRSGEIVPTAIRISATAVHDALGTDIVTTPYIQLGASDSRWFTAISAHVYRFTPFHLTRGERDALHAHNERIRVESWLSGIRFYLALIRAS